MKFREFIASSGKLVIAGKSAIQNEEIVKLAESEEIVLHTKLPGSPFCIIKGKASKNDIKESAIFCARYSRDWKQNKNNVIVHYFKGKDIFKNKEMEKGTFGVKKAGEITAKKEDIEKFKSGDAK